VLTVDFGMPETQRLRLRCLQCFLNFLCRPVEIDHFLLLNFFWTFYPSIAL